MSTPQSQNSVSNLLNKVRRGVTGQPSEKLLDFLIEQYGDRRLTPIGARIFMGAAGALSGLMDRTTDLFEDQPSSDDPGDGTDHRYADADLN